MESLVAACTYETLLVFDATLGSVRAAHDWLMKHPEPCGRVDIPYCMSCGDYLTHRQRECELRSNGTLLSLLSTTEFKVVPASADWCSSIVRAMEDDLLLRDPATGLSAVQKHMLTQTGAVAESNAACSARFQLPIQTIRRQRHLIGTPHSNPHMMPHAVVSGAYPIDPVAFCRLLREHFVDGRHERWSEQPPYAPGYKFARDLDGYWTSECVRDKHGEVVTLPYGVTPGEFSAANPGCDKTGWSLRYSADAKNLCAVPVRWDPVFLGCRYETMNEYVHWWIEEQRNHWALELCKLEDAKRKDVFRRDFIQTLHIGTICPNKHGRVLMILGESLKRKRQRIDDQFGGHQDFLDIPVGEINTDIGKAVPDEEEIPNESGRDLWMRSLPF